MAKQDEEEDDDSGGGGAVDEEQDQEAIQAAAAAGAKAAKEDEEAEVSEEEIQRRKERALRRAEQLRLQKEEALKKMVPGQEKPDPKRDDFNESDEQDDEIEEAMRDEWDRMYSHVDAVSAYKAEKAILKFSETQMRRKWDALRLSLARHRKYSRV